MSLIDCSNHVASEFVDETNRTFRVSTPKGSDFSCVEIESTFPSLRVGIAHICRPELVKLRDALNEHIAYIGGAA